MNRKLIIGGVIAVILVTGIIFGVKAFTAPGAPGGMPEHITIAEAKQGSVSQLVKVGGEVVPGSIIWDTPTQSLQFSLSGEGNQMLVEYHGLAPKDFKPGAALVVEGTYIPTGVFEATSLTTQSSPLCKACHG